jgi:hypothetical protein
MYFAQAEMIGQTGEAKWVVFALIESIPFHHAGRPDESPNHSNLGTTAGVLRTYRL